MGIRKRLARRAVIQRTARIWTRLSKAFLQSAKAELTSWLEAVINEALAKVEKNKKVESIPEMPQGYLQALRSLMVGGLVYGYWLSHLYVQDIRRAYNREQSGDSELKTKLERLLHSQIKLADIGAGGKGQNKPKNKNKAKGKSPVNDSGGLEPVASLEWHSIIPEEAIQWLEDYIPELAGILQEDILLRVREVVDLGLREGLPVKERINQLKEIGPELESMTHLRLETIARTELTRADTMGRLIEYTGCEDVDGVEFNAILDSRTTEICKERDGLVMRLDDARLPENTPPLHPNCRSMLLATTIYDHKGKLKTSSEFDEVPVSIQRDSDIQAVQLLMGYLPVGRT